MNKNTLAERAKEHLEVLCAEIGERRVGSEGNRRATEYVKSVLKKSGWHAESTELKVTDWKTGGASLAAGGEQFEVFSSDCSLGCAVSGEIKAVSTVEQLEKADIGNKIVFLHGEVAKEQISPKNFPFWNPDEHKRIVSLLESGNPIAVVCATERNSALAGGVYPFPLFEDGDFDIPSVFMKDTEGKRLFRYDGSRAELVSKAVRIPETAFNVVGRNNEKSKDKIVISAHIDTKPGTTGAIDNGTGVAALLLIAEFLKTSRPVELAFFNGEDYYCVPGQMEYMRQNFDKFGDIFLNINVDGAGYKEGPACFSAFGLPGNIDAALRKVFADMPEIAEGLPWYQGDHSMFIQNGRPAIAASSTWFIENMASQEITHTEKDNLTIVDYGRVAECAAGIIKLICLL